MDRRQFIASSVSGLAWSGSVARAARGPQAADFGAPEDSAQLPELAGAEIVNSLPADWLIKPIAAKTGVFRTGRPHEIALTNGLIRRTWRLQPNAATVGFDESGHAGSLHRNVVKMRQSIGAGRIARHILPSNPSYLFANKDFRCLCFYN